MLIDGQVVGLEVGSLEERLTKLSACAEVLVQHVVASDVVVVSRTRLGPQAFAAAGGGAEVSCAGTPTDEGIDAVELTLGVNDVAKAVFGGVLLDSSYRRSTEGSKGLGVAGVGVVEFEADVGGDGVTNGDERAYRVSGMKVDCGWNSVDDNGSVGVCVDDGGGGYSDVETLELTVQTRAWLGGLSFGR